MKRRVAKVASEVKGAVQRLRACALYPYTSVKISVNATHNNVQISGCGYVLTNQIAR